MQCWKGSRIVWAPRRNQRHVFIKMEIRFWGQKISLGTHTKISFFLISNICFYYDVFVIFTCKLIFNTISIISFYQDKIGYWADRCVLGLKTRLVKVSNKLIVAQTLYNSLWIVVFLWSYYFVQGKNAIPEIQWPLAAVAWQTQNFEFR